MKLLLCLIKNYAMGVLLPASLASALVDGEWLILTSGRSGEEHSVPSGQESGFDCNLFKIVLMVLVLEYRPSLSLFC
jgi:hypothetical protein